MIYKTYIYQIKLLKILFETRIIFIEYLVKFKALKNTPKVGLAYPNRVAIRTKGAYIY